MLAFAVHLTDTNEGDGGFCIVRGSHKSNYPCPPAMRRYEHGVEHAYQPAVNAGDVVIFTEATTHGTLPWRGVHQRRKHHLQVLARDERVRPRVGGERRVAGVVSRGDVRRAEGDDAAAVSISAVLDRVAVAPDGERRHARAQGEAQGGLRPRRVQGGLLLSPRRSDRPYAVRDSLRPEA